MSGSAAQVHDDYAGMLAAVEAELDADAVRAALGADGDELLCIRCGQTPERQVAERLLLLYDLSQRAERSDTGQVPRASVVALPRRLGRRAVLPFLAADAALVLGAAAVLLVALD